jgi:eukaryotic-like serine/threonine-protein kinase
MSDPGPIVFNGRYELHRRLGRGGMADVSLARDQLLDRPVAVKALFPEFATDPAFVERFRREATAAANLNHPNIVGVYDWGEAEGTYFIVMEFVDGRSVSEILSAEGAFHPDRVADIGSDVAAALGFAHRSGVVHRDVKPGNVLIDRSGQVKVADFGIARAITASTDDNLTQAGTVMGTATYFSPEQARGDPVDPRSDIYSLGCVLYEMAVGRPPFSGETPVAIAYKHVHETPTPPRHLSIELPTALEAIILKCLAKNPANRYPTAEDLRADLRRFREGNRILAEPLMAPPVDPGATGVLPATAAVPAAAGGTVAQPAYVPPDYEDDYDEPRRSGAFLVVLLLLLAVLAGVLFLLAQTLGLGEDDPDVALVDVRSVVDQPVETATQQLQADGFEVEAIPEANPDVEEGIVFAQTPEGGTQAEEGSTIELRVSAGAEPVEVPELVGMEIGEARRFLSTHPGRFTVREEPVADDAAPEGEVVDQSPAAGEEAAPESELVLSVSSGPEDVLVPDVAGRTVSQASNILGQEGLSVSDTVTEESDTINVDRVIRTDPPADTPLPPGSEVVLVVSSGAPEESTVPSVVGDLEGPAADELDAAGFAVDVVDEDTTDPARDGRVLSQSPRGGAVAEPGDTVQITVGRLVVVDDGGGGGDGGGDGGTTTG